MENLAKRLGKTKAGVYDLIFGHCDIGKVSFEEYREASPWSDDERETLLNAFDVIARKHAKVQDAMREK